MKKLLKNMPFLLVFFAVSAVAALQYSTRYTTTSQSPPTSATVGVPVSYNGGTLKGLNVTMGDTDGGNHVAAGIGYAWLYQPAVYANAAGTTKTLADGGNAGWVRFPSLDIQWRDAGANLQVVSQVFQPLNQSNIPVLGPALPADGRIYYTGAYPVDALANMGVDGGVALVPTFVITGLYQ